MQTIAHHGDGGMAVQVISHGILLASEQDMLDLMMNVDYQTQSKRIIINRSNIDDRFFDLGTGLAGAVLQKISNYGYRLAIIGDFSEFESEALQAFIRESNRSGQVLFVPDLETAIAKLCV
jgi:hypothetical protein